MNKSSALKAGIVVFPGTNCDKDTFEACIKFGWEAQYIWHTETKLNDINIIFLPGGFSYGDYLRSGALAKFSPIMDAVKQYIKKKRGVVIGICNGFQILCEAGILPGALTYNENLKFICKDVELTLQNNSNSSSLTLPIAHAEGRYVADEKTLRKIKEKDMIFLKYKNNPNGSAEDIAGLYDKEKQVLGMMPHPERAFCKELGNENGKKIFQIINLEAKAKDE